MTVESRELALYTINTGELYRGQGLAIIANLAKKMKQGKFNKELAVKAFEYLADSGSKMYDKDFGYRFSKSDRKLAAEEILEHYMEQITEQSKQQHHKAAAPGNRGERMDEGMKTYKIMVSKKEQKKILANLTADEVILYETLQRCGYYNGTQHTIDLLNKLGVFFQYEMKAS